MDKIIQENNKNTYRWEMPKDKGDVYFPEMVVEETDDNGMDKIQEKAMQALGREENNGFQEIEDMGHHEVEELLPPPNKYTRPLEFESV